MRGQECEAVPAPGQPGPDVVVAQTFERVEQEVGVQIENRCQRDERRLHSISYGPRSSATRALTNRFTSVAGGGLVRGNRTVPVEVS